MALQLTECRLPWHLKHGKERLKYHKIGLSVTFDEARKPANSQHLSLPARFLKNFKALNKRVFYSSLNESRAVAGNPGQQFRLNADRDRYFFVR